MNIYSGDLIQQQFSGCFMSLLPHAECYSYSYIPNCLVQQLCDLQDSDYLHKSQVPAHCLLHNIHAVLKGVIFALEDCMQSFSGNSMVQLLYAK